MNTARNKKFFFLCYPIHPCIRFTILNAQGESKKRQERCSASAALR